MTEFGDIQQNFNTPFIDKMKERSKHQKIRNSKPFQVRKVAFEVNPEWCRCFTGREEIAYENL